MSTAARLAREAQAVFEAADKQNRSLTADERIHVEGLLDRAKEHGEMEKKMREFDPGLGAGMEFSRFSDPNVSFGAGDSPGEMFVSSEGYKSIARAESRPQSWSSGLVEVSNLPLSMKGTLMEGTGAPGSGTGGGLIPVPQVVPGIVDKLFQPLRFEDLILSGQATTNTIRYAVEGTATSGAAGVAEGALKPESSLAFSTLDEPVKKVATTLVVADELIEDAPAVTTFVNGRLSLFVSIEAERQLIRGTSGGNEVQGLLTSRGVPVYTGGTADNKAVQLFKAMNSMRGSALVEPEWTMIHPTDYQIIRLLADQQGQLLGGGPFLGPYGGQSQAGASGQITGAVDTLWGKPVYVTTAVGGAGTALVGTRAGAQAWNRGGMSVEATNAHSDHFFRNLSAIRAERRLGLTVYRPSSYLEIRYAVGPGG